jgi:hypothetical protein
VISTNISSYFQHVCEEWGYISSTNYSSGYEQALDALKNISTEAWKRADDTHKRSIENKIFEIYRTINVIPITYFNIDGVIEEVKSITTKIAKINVKVLQSSNIGQSLCNFWFPNIQTAYTYHDKQIGLKHRFYNDVKLRRAILICLKFKRSVLPAELKSALGLVSGNAIQNYKPMHARAVYEYICPIFNGSILDFSSGYGGRMLGAMTSNLRYHYTGIEPNTQTYRGLSSLGELISSVNGGNCTMVNAVSEEFSTNSRSVDAAFSSPPYFNLEIYSDEGTQCMHRYKTIDAWFELYVEPTLKMLHTTLRDEGLYAVNIADYTVEKKRFEIVNRWIALSKKCNFIHCDTLHMKLQARPGGDKVGKQENIFIFKKC